jgi:hypothetical protein
MKSLRIRGLVAMADGLRRELSSPISPERLNDLRHQIADTTRQVRRLLADNHMSLDALPAPSRRAFVYISGLNLDAVSTSAHADANDRPASSVRLVGLRAFLDRLLAALAQVDDASDAQREYAAITTTDTRCTDYMDERAITLAQLTEESRAIRVWLAYFSDRTRFDAYLAAIRLARPIMDRAAKTTKRFGPPVRIHFRPAKGLYRLRRERDFSLLQLPTAMIAFDSSDFTQLARFVFTNRGDRQYVRDRFADGPCRAVALELERMAGPESGGGVVHDLRAAAAKVNAAYFDETLAVPKLSWSRSITGRKFGHYNFADDSLMVSASLDSTDVPAYVVEYVIYHELLHKKHGVQWQKGRQNVHTPEFKREEKRFVEFDAAEAALKKLADRYG